MTVKIHGKDYKTVAERLNELKIETSGKYNLATDIIQFSEQFVVMKATIEIPDRGIFNGHAYERQDSSHINKAAYIENAETSAIGRALAAAGYSGTEFCSADELVGKLSAQTNTNNTPVEQQSTQPQSEGKCSDCGKEVKGNYSRCWVCNEKSKQS